MRPMIKYIPLIKIVTKEIELPARIIAGTDVKNREYRGCKDITIKNTPSMEMSKESDKSANSADNIGPKKL